MSDLLGENYHAALGFFAFGFGAHKLRVGEHEMDDLSLRRKHRLEFLRRAFAHGALEHRKRQIFELIGSMGSIAFRIDCIVPPIRANAGVERVVEDQIERFERIAMAADQRCEVRPGYLEILAFGAADVVDIDRSKTHLLEDLKQETVRRLCIVGHLVSGARRRRASPWFAPASCAAASAATGLPPDRAIANVGRLFFKLEIVFIQHC
jgi:hypothetical protein